MTKAQRPKGCVSKGDDSQNLLVELLHFVWFLPFVSRQNTFGCGCGLSKALGAVFALLASYSKADH